MSIDPPFVEIVETEDGSQTLRNTRLGVTYRSMQGAHQESRHVFVEGTFGGGARRSVLELGLGAGTNLAMTVEHAHEHGYELEYVVFEHEVLRERRLDHGELANRVLDDLLARGRVVCEGMKFELYEEGWGERSFEHEFDSVYFDPFGPSVDDAWDTGAFRFARDHMHDSSILGTYSAASSVKRAMVAAGLSIATAPGPGRKREVTFAARTTGPLARYELLDSERYR